jgi:predicted nucleotidyltransferase
MEKRRAVLPETLAAEILRLGDRYGIRNIRVFGSFARGDDKPGSDIDLLVDYVPGHGALLSWTSATPSRRS